MTIPTCLEPGCDAPVATPREWADIKPDFCSAHDWTPEGGVRQPEIGE